MLFIGAHLVLGVLLRANPTIATLHALLTCMVAVWAVLRWSTVSIACVAAYAAGADVLWRMTGAHVPWEISKYLVVFCCLGGLLRLGRRAHWNLLAITYILALAPSIVVLIQEFHGGLRALAQPLSFNLSGPLSLFASVWYMSQLSLSRRDVHKLIGCLLAPILAIALMTALTTNAATDLTFTDESSKATSAGFGPNQVSLALGLGALLSFIVAVDPEAGPLQRWSAYALFPVFGVQSALTFSRGGLYSFAFAALPAALLSLHNRASRKWLAVFTGALTMVTALVIVPRLDEFTGGQLSARFADTNPTHRDAIIHEDLRLWGEHPILGLGPGGAMFQRRGESTLAHTEYTRLLSEHGLFGVVALLALIAICATVLLKRQPLGERALRVAFMVWSLVSMLHAGMRLAAIGFVFGWGCARTLLARRTVIPEASISPDGFSGTAAGGFVPRATAVTASDFRPGLR
ncbi:MAG: O-antigen ligase family protein [Gemmatimonadaceae bacterium]